MGRKNNRKERTKAHYTEEQEDDNKGFEALAGNLTPEWWNRADKHQTAMIAAIEYYKVTMVDARAGTGKTTIAVKMALDALKAGSVDTIRYVRFVDQRTQKLGFLPGDPSTKEYGFMHPFFEALEECGLQTEAIVSLMAHKVLETSTDIHMRGRNMKRTFLIVDECQNGDIEDMRVVFTRWHDKVGRMVVIGHSGQVDRRLPRFGREKLIPFQVYQRHMDKKPWTKLVTLTKDYRGEVSQWADEIDHTIKELEESK
jgi:phosphate starvation-inducible PhoH-like protein/PhoH-like ATPase